MFTFLEYCSLFTIVFEFFSFLKIEEIKIIDCNYCLLFSDVVPHFRQWGAGEGTVGRPRILGNPDSLMYVNDIERHAMSFGLYYDIQPISKVLLFPNNITHLFNK